jgi:ectoine hydroxylase-related dioxygenase (phytanoyl-CoA dioxygenase family)
VVNLAEFEREGFAIEPSLLPSSEIDLLIALIEWSAKPEQGRGGVRDIMHAIPELQAVATGIAVQSIVRTILGPKAFVVRATLFDKTESANWKVPWHQDVTIAVQDRRDGDGYGPWSIKAGAHHVQPPADVLERMVAVRIHLDPCPESNGALRVMPGTHKLGRLNQNNVEPFIDEQRAVTCEAAVGEALVMRPLLLHSSSVSLTPAHRRVLHFDFATGQLANGLIWRMR